MSLSMSRLVNVLSTNGFLDKEYEGTTKGQRKSVKCEDKTHAILTRLVFQCLKEGELKDPVNDVLIVPHGIQTTRFIIHLRRYSDFPHRRLVSLFEGHVAQQVGIDRCLQLEKLIHQVVDNPSLSLEHFLGLVLLNKLHLNEEMDTVEDGVRYKGVVTNNTKSLATLLNDILLNSLEPLFDLPLMTGMVDLKPYLKGTHHTILAMQDMELKVKLDMDTQQFVISTTENTIDVDIEGGQLDSLKMMIPNQTVSSPPLSSKVIKEVSVKPKHNTKRKKVIVDSELALKEIYQHFSMIGIHSDDLQGIYLDNLLGYDALFAKQLKALSQAVIPFKSGKDLYAPVTLMKHCVDFARKLEGVDIDGFSWGKVNVEGLTLFRIHNETDDRSVFFPTTPHKSPHKDDFLGDGTEVIRRYLGGERTIPVLFYIFILLRFSDDDFSESDYHLKESVFINALVKAGVVDKDSDKDPFFELVSRAKQLVGVNSGFKEYLLENLITIYESTVRECLVVRKDRHSIKVTDPVVERRKDPLRTKEGLDTENDVPYQGYGGQPVIQGDVKVNVPQEASTTLSSFLTEAQFTMYPEAETTNDEENCHNDDVDLSDAVVDIDLLESLDLPKTTWSQIDTPPWKIDSNEDEELGKLLYEADEKNKLEKQAKRIAGLFLRQYEHAIENGNLLRYSLQEFAKTKGFEFALQEEGVYVEIDDSTPPQVFAYCIFNNEESVRIFFEYEGDILDLYN